MAKKRKIDPEVERKKYEDSVRYLYFGRYLMVRYFTAILFFANLFWLVFCSVYGQITGITVATIALVFASVATIEQLSKMHNNKPDIPLTRRYLWIQIGINIILGILLFTELGKQLFPFATTQSSKYIVLLMLLFGIFLCILCERKIDSIRKGNDRYAKIITNFKNSRQ